MFETPDRQPWRHCLPHPAHLAHLQVQGVAVYRSRCRSLHILQADEAHSLGDGAAAGISGGRQNPRHRQGLAPRRFIPATVFSENAAFAEACEAAGIAFVGPTPELRVFGLKHTARAWPKHGVPMLEGTELLDSLDAALIAGEQVGYPVMLKSTAGGGGIGMRVCRSAPS
jgi:urea carboxylase